LALGAALGSCLKTRHQDYRARSVTEGEGTDRLVVEQAGIRASAGPPAEFPYAIERSGRSVERGRYQLFTRIRIENRRQDAVEVLWPEARIELPAGEPVGLVDAGAAHDGAEEGAAPAAAERVEPGREAARALIPASLRTVEVAGPRVARWDGRKYRMAVPVRVAGRRELLVLPFRLEAERRDEGGVRFLFWD